MKQLSNTEAKEVYRALTQQFYGKPIELICNDLLVAHFSTDNGLAFCSVFNSNLDKEQFSIGNFQTIEDEATGYELLNSAIEFINKNKGKKIYGPMHGNTFFPYRFTKFTDDEKATFFTSEMIHKAYYPKFWESCGFKGQQFYNSYFSEINQSTQHSPISFTRIEVDKLSQPKLLRDLYEFAIVAFSKNVLFESVSFNTFKKIYTPILPALNTPLSQVIYEEDKIIGLFFAFPDKNLAQTIVVKTLARLPDNKYKGLATQMSHQSVYDAYQLGFRKQIHAYFHQDNKSKRISKNFGGSAYKEHVLYSLELNKR